MYGKTDYTFPWPTGYGEMAARIRDHDWAATPLGAIDAWPQSLRTTVDIMLALPGPASILWGPDRVQLYNDAYVTIAAERHPAALGSAAAHNWSEAYQAFLGPIFERVFAGETVSIDEHAVPLRTPDGAEERFFTATFLPVRDESGCVRGVFHPLTEVTAKVRADAERREREERLRRVFDIETVGVVFFDLVGGIHEANDAFLALIGYTRDELEAGEVRYERLTPPDWRWRDEQTIRELKATGRAGPFEKEYTRKDGSRIWILCADKRLDDETAVEFIVDVTERKRAEEALRETSRRLNAILDNTREAVFLMDSRQHCVYANAAAEELTGYEFKEMQGRPLHEVVHHKKPDGSHYPLEECPIDRAFPERAQVSGEELFVHKDGSFYPVAFTASPVLDDGGTPIGTVIEARNIASEKARDAALLESEARVRALTDNLPAGMVYQIATGADGRERRFLYVSQSHEKLTGIPAEAVLSDPTIPYNLIVPEDRCRLVEAEEQSVRSKTNFDVEVRFRRADGELRWCRIISAPREQADGSIIWDGIQIDTTEQKKVEAALRELNETLESRVATRTAELEQAHEQLRQSQKLEAMGQLTGGVSHDFNNLLSPIIGSLDVLQRKGLGGEREQRLIDGALQSAERAKVLVQRLLAFARRQPLQARPVDIGALVAGMGDLVASTTGPQVKVVADVAPDLPAAVADPNQIEMAILNLAVNARDAMPQGGTLRISAEPDTVGTGHRSVLRPGRYVRLSVADTGTGMDETTLKRAVEPFFSTKGIGRGTGLGLSMVHGLAAQLGGALTIESKPGLGTNVEIWLPASDQVALQPERSENGEAQPAVGTALLVDDQELVRSSIADMLSDLGYAVVQAGSAEEALRLVDDGLVFDVLITDHLMPGMTGTELAREVRVRRTGARVLVVSGYAEVDDIAPDLSRLTKPFRQADLAAKLAELEQASAG